MLESASLTLNFHGTFNRWYVIGQLRSDFDPCRLCMAAMARHDRNDRRGFCPAIRIRFSADLTVG
jgi:hypothetical protein